MFIVFTRVMTESHNIHDYYRPLRKQCCHLRPTCYSTSGCEAIFIGMNKRLCDSKAAILTVKVDFRLEHNIVGIARIHRHKLDHCIAKEH